MTSKKKRAAVKQAQEKKASKKKAGKKKAAKKAATREEPPAKDSTTAQPLMVLNREEAPQVFNEGMETVLETIKERALDFEADASTAAGRQTIKGMAYRVKRSKTFIDELGKELGAEYREKLEKVNSTRRLARSRLDDLAQYIRAPVDEWEADRKKADDAVKEIKRLAEPVDGDNAQTIMARIENIKAIDPTSFVADKQEAVKLASYDAQKDLGRQMDAVVEREREAAQKREEERLERERQQREREEEIRREEREKARREAEAARRAEEAARENAHQPAQAPASHAGQSPASSPPAAEEAAPSGPQPTQPAAAPSTPEDERAHQARINRQVVWGLVNCAGLSEDQAKAVVKATVRGHVPGLMVLY